MAKIVTVRVPEELHAKLLKKMTGTPRTFQALLLGWLDEWANETKGDPKATSGKNKWQEMLGEILASGSEDAIPAIQENLKAFVELARFEKAHGRKPRA